MKAASRIVNGIGTWELRLENGSVRFCSEFMRGCQKMLRLASGYGATTLPALTEAITIENNVTLANYEIIRLTERVEKMAAALRA